MPTSTEQSGLADLIEVLQFVQTKIDADSYTALRPFHCEHDELWLCVDASLFTEAEQAWMDEKGFFVDDEGFKSFRFGSA